MTTSVARGWVVKRRERAKRSLLPNRIPPSRRAARVWSLSQEGLWQQRPSARRHFTVEERRREAAALLGGAVGKDTASRTWRKVKSDCEPGTPAGWPGRRSYGSFSTVRSCACDSTAKRPPSRCLLSSACGRTAGRCLLSARFTHRRYTTHAHFSLLWSRLGTWLSTCLIKINSACPRDGATR
jgi:hypothetical protein